MKIDSTSKHFQNRSNLIDYGRLPALCYVGNYTRILPVSLTRMIENAYDWEHLPFVHASTFHNIELIEQGRWGWRAQVGTAKSKGARKNRLELLVDANKGYWATTVLSGFDEGIEIHTQATPITARQIEINVKFYLPDNTYWLRRKLSHWYLKNQYKNLYAEDQQLMQDRQNAIDEKNRWNDKPNIENEVVQIGIETELDKQQVHLVEGGRERFCVIFNNGQWCAYSAVCTHQLGDLSSAVVDAQGTVTCPWHGYRFSVLSGENLDHKCARLRTPEVVLEGGMLLLRL